MDCPQVVLFDLDDTLAPSLEPPKPDMTARLMRLLAVTKVAIITGRNFPRIEPDFLPVIAAAPQIGDFYLFPEAGAECLQWREGAWQIVYSHGLSPEEFDRVRTTVAQCLADTGAYEGLPRFGEQIVRKRTMYTLMALGVDVPQDLKYTWDPGNERRTKLWHVLVEALPEFDVVMGGATAIDVTKKGIDKAYGVRWLSAQLGIPASDMLYVGDAFFEGGNDRVVIQTDVQIRQTSGPTETMMIIDELLKLCASRT